MAFKSLSFFFTFYANQQTSRKSTSLQIMQIDPILFCIFKVWYCAVAAEAAATKAAAASMKSWVAFIWMINLVEAEGFGQKHGVVATESFCYSMASTSRPISFCCGGLFSALLLGLLQPYVPQAFSFSITSNLCLIYQEIMAHQHRSHLMLLLLALVTALAGQQGAKAYTATSAKDNSRQNHYGTKQHRAQPEANLLVVVIGGWVYFPKIFFLYTLFEIFIFCPKIELWFPEKIVDFS